MAYPGSMSRGKKPVVRKGTRKKLEKYFATKFPLLEVCESAPNVARRYDQWHRARTAEIAGAIRPYIPKYNKPMAVATKFLDTFMHQLMKYEQCRALRRALHLPLDARVFAVLRRMKPPSLSKVQCLFSKGESPYKLKYEEYLHIQTALRGLRKELNARPGAEFNIPYRIELNCLLWTKDAF